MVIESQAPNTNEGVFHSLIYKGKQDEWMDYPSEVFDAKRHLLQNYDYRVFYSKIDTIKETHVCERTKRNTILFKVQPNCDFINMLDIVVPNLNNAPINSILRRVEVEFGGHRMDIMNVTDIETQIRTNAALFGRSINTINGKIFIPLTMAPFHENNVVNPSTLYHQLSIWVDLHDEYYELRDAIELYGNVYYVNVSDKRQYLNTGYDMVTTQNQFCGEEIMKKGVNKFKIRFNHPMYLMYFWGFDKTKVKNIKLMLNDKVAFFNGPVEILEHTKINKGFGSLEPIMLFFSPDKPCTRTKSILNFSRIDNAYIEIDTDQEDETPMYMVGINMQSLRCSCGMVGLVFSK